MIPFEKDELDEWKANPITRWWFGKMQQQFDEIAEIQPIVDMTSVDRTALSAVHAKGVREGFIWALNFDPEGDSDENQASRKPGPR